MSWLSQLIEKLFCWVPRIWLIGPDEGGVRETCGKWYRAIAPGWYIYWPVLQKCISITVTPQVINLPNQSMMTKDRHIIAISGAIEYSIPNAEKAILCVRDFDTSLRNLAMGTIARYLNRKSYEECGELGGLEREVLGALRRKVDEWGLSIIKFWITDFVEHKVYRIMTHDTPISLVIPEEE